MPLQNFKRLSKSLHWNVIFCCFLVTVCTASALYMELPKQIERDTTKRSNASKSINNSDNTHQKGQLLSFASYYGDHMVLQRAPKAATVWGYADPSLVGKKVDVTMANSLGHIVQKLTSTVVKGTSTHARWRIKLKATNAGGPYKITVNVGQHSINMSDLLFGDVWLCSGQSNMQFTVTQLMSGDLNAELAAVSMYSHIRLFTVLQTKSSVPEVDLISVLQKWAVASKESLDGSQWQYFSAVCWLYGRRLYESLGYPIGLIASDYGGTPVKSWSSPDALKMCKQEKAVHIPDGWSGVIWDNSVLWNAMIHPLLNMTIYGVIWYQGEADKNSHNYNCTFPAMIADWRRKFNLGSNGETNKQFPFGFVQLAPSRDNSSIVTGFPSIRWQQTANKGYVPNKVMPNVFMAVTMDLPDFKSPYGSIHPRFKETLADRLHLAGLSVAYGVNILKFQGPMPSFYYIVMMGKWTVRIFYDTGKTPLRVLNVNGFEVCCGYTNVTSCEETSPSWGAAPVVSHDMTSVRISADACARSHGVSGVRYAWRESPCPYKRCAVYSAENFLPAPPFVKYFKSDSDVKVVTSKWSFIRNSE